MSQISGTTWSNATATYSWGPNIREDLEDTIWLLDPMDTYCLSNFDKVDATSTFHEWLTDSLAAAATNRQIEGDDPSYSTAVAANRLGNYQQINRKNFMVSGTLEVVNKAGRASEVKRLAVKLMKELKRDMEISIVTNQASSIGGASTARSTASIESWIAGPTTTNNSTAANAVATTSNAGATTAGFSGGTVATPTDGTTTGAFTINSLTLALQGAWSAGGNPSTIIASAYVKQTYLDQFTGVATRYVDVDRTAQASVINAANVFVSSFGTHTVILSRYARNSVCLAIDPNYWAISFLRRPFVESLAQTGDAQRREIISEWGVVARNPNASSKVVAIT